MSYVQLRSESLRAMFASAGFSRVQEIDGRSPREEVYERRHHVDPSYVVRVYSSIPADGSTVRGCGKDAIRVVALLVAPRKTYPIAKMPRVFRTAPQGLAAEAAEAHVCERLRERMREAYAVVNERLKRERQAKGAA